MYLGRIGCVWGVLGATWGDLGASRGRLGASWGVFRTSWDAFRTSWGVFRASWGVFGTSWGRVVAIYKIYCKTAVKMNLVHLISVWKSSENRQTSFSNHQNRLRASRCVLKRLKMRLKSVLRAFSSVLIRLKRGPKGNGNKKNVSNQGDRKTYFYSITTCLEAS